MTDMKDFNVAEFPTWCPGCGNFGIWTALKKTFSEMDLKPEDCAVISGVGCHGKFPYWFRSYGFSGLHGRPLPLAQGAKIANHKLNVVVMSGDGDCYGEGGNHFIHACRRNVDITLIVHNNGNYGLTTGQYSPTSRQEYKSKTSPFGVEELPVNPLMTSLTMGATFVARGYAGNMPLLVELIKKGMQHKGFAHIDVLQPCVTFNKIDTYEALNSRVYDLNKEGHDTKDWKKAFEKAQENERMPIGVFYEGDRPSFEQWSPQLKETALVEKKLQPDVRDLLEGFY
ncbi:2-oxoacid ferredoxin oxidoreductase [Candidatus Woesearchaeota archaeon]|nr:2-oxoacid ferredoxin oxidoreductase [Candidatus Woesearchaeota archaeon]